MRGSKPNNPPLSWTAIGLSMLDIINGDNTWIIMDKEEGEWYVAYHGIGQEKETE